MKFEDIYREAELARDSFIRILEAFPGFVNKIAIDYYDKAKKGPLRMPVLAELAPWVLSDLIGLSTYDPAKVMSEPWFLLNLYSLSYRRLESLGNMSDQSLEMTASKLLLQKGITLFYALNPNARTEIPQLIDSWFDQTSNPPSLDKLIEFDVSSFETSIAKELSIQTISMFMCSQILCIRALRQTPSRDIIYKIAPLILSLRILDGLTHWYEDMTIHGQNNLLSTMMLRNIDRKVDIKLLTKDEMFLFLASSGDLMRILDMTLSLSRIALEGFKKTSTPIRFYLESIFSNIRHAIAVLNSLRPELESIKGEFSKKSLSRFLSTSRGNNVAKEIAECISGLAEEM